MSVELEVLRQAAIACARDLEKKMLRVKLTTRAVKMVNQAGEERYEDVDYCDIYVIGDANSMVSKALKHLSSDQARDFAPLIAYYRAAKDTVPEQGTSLDLVNWLSPAQSMTYKASGILTLENLAALNDAQIQKFGMGCRDHVKKAQAYLLIAKEGADASRLVEMEKRLRDENDDLRRQLGELKALVDSLTDKKMADLEIPEALRRTA
jgi:hypothetical protein